MADSLERQAQRFLYSHLAVVTARIIFSRNTELAEAVKGNTNQAIKRKNPHAAGSTRDVG